MPDVFAQTEPRGAAVTPTADLLAEYLACEDLGPAAARWLVRQSVPDAALFVGQQGVPVLAATVSFGRGCFEFERHHAGDAPCRALVWPVWDEWGDQVDLAAWNPRSGAVGVWLGRVAMLGQEQLHRRAKGERLIVHATVLDWFRAGREGVAIVDQRRAVALLRDAGPLLVDDAAFGTQLERALTVRSPKIWVREAA